MTASPTDNQPTVEPVEPVDPVEVSENQQDHEQNAEQVHESNESQTGLTPTRTKVYEHLSSYPIANSWMRIHSQVPIPHVLRPRLFALVYTPPLKQYTEMIDSTLDSYLNTLDERVPQVKTLRMRDIRDSMTNPVVNGAQNVNKIVNERVTTPIRSTVHELRKTYSPRGTAIVRSQFDPLVKPINTRLESIVSRLDHYNEEPVETNHPDNFSSELSHTMCILSDGYHKGTPILVNRVRSFQNLPRRVNEEVNTIYQANKQKRGDGSLVVFVASIDTARQLAGNSYSFASSRVSDAVNDVFTRVYAGNTLASESEHRIKAVASTPIEMEVAEAV